jgi:uncharacterized membrane protein (UPF0127 family)
VIKTILTFLFTFLSAVEIVVQDIPLQVELATTHAEQTKGLSGRKSLPEGTGMLFVYEKAQVCYFWMKDTTIPLSVGFFDKNRHLIEWKDLPPPGEKPLTIVSSSKPALYALEVPRGWFLRHQIQAGAEFSYVPK